MNGSPSLLKLILYWVKLNSGFLKFTASLVGDKHDYCVISCLQSRFLYVFRIRTKLRFLPPTVLYLLNKLAVLLSWHFPGESLAGFHSH